MRHTATTDTLNRRLKTHLLHSSSMQLQRNLYKCSPSRYLRYRFKSTLGVTHPANLCTIFIPLKYRDADIFMPLTATWELFIHCML